MVPHHHFVYDIVLRNLHCERPKSVSTITRYLADVGLRATRLDLEYLTETLEGAIHRTNTLNTNTPSVHKYKMFYTFQSKLDSTPHNK
jgi:hypothetical protein